MLSALPLRPQPIRLNHPLPTSPLTILFNHVTLLIIRKRVRRDITQWASGQVIIDEGVGWGGRGRWQLKRLILFHWCGLWLHQLTCCITYLRLTKAPGRVEGILSEDTWKTQLLVIKNQRRFLIDWAECLNVIHRHQLLVAYWSIKDDCSAYCREIALCGKVYVIKVNCHQ